MENYQTYQNLPKVQKNRWWILVSVGLFTFMSTLDSSIVNIALPVISHELKVPMNQVEWVVSIYLMVICGLLLLFGKIGDSIGKIKVFKIGMWVFTLGSLLCGVNHSLGFLLFARMVQALGASMTMATNSGIITEIFPMEERGRALGLIGSFVSLGSIAGPGIGGLILAQFPWAYIFWINVPVGLATILLGKYYLPDDLLKSQEKLDKPGFTFFALAIFSLFGGIFLGQETGFLTLVPLLLFVVALVSFLIFVQVEKRQTQPLIAFEIFKNKLFTISLLTALLIFASNFFCNVVLPFYLQNALGYSSSKAGLLMMVFPLLMVIGAPIAGYFTDKIGPEVLTVAGLIILSLSAFLYFRLDLNSSLTSFILASALMGIGNALFQSPNNTTVMSSVEKEKLGMATSLNSLARNLGMVLGIAAATTILYAAMSSKYGSHLTTYLNERPDVFIYGMKVTFLASFGLCLIATGLTLYRFLKSKKNE